MTAVGLYWTWYEWAVAIRLAFPPGLVMLELRVGPLQLVAARVSPQ